MSPPDVSLRTFLRHVEYIRKQIKRYRETRKYLTGVYQSLHDRLTSMESLLQDICVHVQFEPAGPDPETESEQGVDD